MEPGIAPRHTSTSIWPAAAAVVAVASVIWMVVLPGRSLAHAIVRATAPRADEVVADPPDRVVMRFNEPVELSFGAIRVFDTDGRRVDSDEADHLPGRPEAVEVGLDGGLPTGTYTVTWRVVSADGHPISEAFVFHVGEPGDNPQGIADQILAGDASAGRLERALFGVVRWVNFAGLIVLAGCLSFLVIVWRRADGGASEDVRRRFAARMKVLVVASWAAVVIATAAGFVLQGAVAGAMPLEDALSFDVMAAVAGTRFGRVAILKLAVLAAGAIAWIAASRRRAAAAPPAGTERPSSRGGRWAWIAVAAAVVVLLATPGLSGHAGTTEPVAVNIAADTLHLVAAAVWLGGLTVLVFAGFGAVRGLPQQEGAPALVPVVSRFSDAAVAAVAVLVVTGTYRAWVEVGALRALTGAAYGWVLLAKLAVFVPLIALGAVNNRWTKPRLQRALERGEAKAPLTTLRRLVTAEIVLGAVVVAVTALLVNLPPAKIAAGVVGPFITDVRLGSYNLNVLVDPNEVGANEVHLTAKSPEGQPAPIEDMKVLFRMQRDDIGPLVGNGTELAPGHFVVQGRHLSVTGRWRLEVVARVGRFDEERTEVEVTVN